MHNRALEYVLEGLAEAGGPTFVVGWADRDTVGSERSHALVRGGLVPNHPCAKSVVCPGCEEACAMPVEQRKTESGYIQFIVCDRPQDLGRIAIDSRHLARWSTDIEMVASCVGNVIGTSTRPKMLIPNGLVQLGHAEINGNDIACFLARDGSDTVLGHPALRGAAHPLVLHFGQIQNCEVAHLDIARAISFRNEQLWFDAGAAAKALMSATPPAHENVFRRHGQMWEARFQGTSVNLAHTLGLRYLAELLGRPRQPISVTSLCAAIQGNGKELVEAGLKASDKRSLADVRKAIETTRAEMARAREEGALGKAAELETREKALRAELTRDFGKTGRSRIQRGASERARQTVQKAIKAAVTRIAKAHPGLGAHLKRAIRTGHECVYNPAQSIQWKIIS